jgi:hypothetical protein
VVAVVFGVLILGRMMMCLIKRISGNIHMEVDRIIGLTYCFLQNERRRKVKVKHLFIIL